MINVIEAAIELLRNNTELMKLLGGNGDAICYIRAPRADIQPRIELSVIDDADGHYTDNEPSSYSADISLRIYKKDSRQLYEIGFQINETFTGHGFSRRGNSDGYDFNVDMCVKELEYRCVVIMGENGFQWIKGAD